MGGLGDHYSFLRNNRVIIMTTLILEDTQVLADDHTITDLEVFLKKQPSKSDLILILKTHDIHYQLCSFQKNRSFLKVVEYTSDHWVGQKKISKNVILIGGFIPSPFMQNAIHIIAQQKIPLKGVFLWSDMILQSYGPFQPGWTLVWHNYNLLICHDGILKMSRVCYLPFSEELPAILRYLKRFGYQENMPLMLFKSSLFSDHLPSFVTMEVRIPQDLCFQGFEFNISELNFSRRLYLIPDKIRKWAYAIMIFNMLGVFYLGLQIYVIYEQQKTLERRVNNLPKVASINQTSLAMFHTYCQLIENRADPLSFFRQLMPLFKDQKGFITYFQWTAQPFILTLQLKYLSQMSMLEHIVKLRSALQTYKITWEPQGREDLMGVLKIEKQTLKCSLKEASQAIRHSEKIQSFLKDRDQTLNAFKSCYFEDIFTEKDLQKTISYAIDFGPSSILEKTQSLITQKLSFWIPCLKDQEIFIFVDSLMHQGPGIFFIHEIEIHRVKNFTKDMLIKASSQEQPILFNGKIVAQWTHR